jgi:two-component system, response regulator
MNFTDILIVEDNRHDVAMILDALQEQSIGDKVSILNNGADALDYVFGSQGCLLQPLFNCPKFILLDLKLPKVGGLDVLRRLKSDERTRDIPVIIFTSSNETKDRRESYLLGANSYIVKPLDADRFSRYVNEIASYWLSMNRTSYQDR